MSKLYFHKCALFLLFSSLSTFSIHYFHSYLKILTDSPHSQSQFHPDSPTPIPRIPNLIPNISTPIPHIPTLTQIPCIPTSILCIPTLIPRIPFLEIANLSYVGNIITKLQHKSINQTFTTSCRRKGMASCTNLATFFACTLSNCI